MKEQKIENDLINKLSDLKYTYRADIKDRATLEKNFREKFESLNQVKLTDKEFERLCEEIITPDTFNAAKILRGINTFKREDETPLNYTLVNIKDWCKNTFEVINQLRMNTDYSHHIYDVVLLINGIPVVQIELKTLGINPRRAMQQIVEYKNDAGNGYNKTLMCFLQLFVVSNQFNTWYFANKNSRHFAFDADERFLPLYQYADKNNRPINHLDEFAEPLGIRKAWKHAQRSQALLQSGCAHGSAQRVLKDVPHGLGRAGRGGQAAPILHDRNVDALLPRCGKVGQRGRALV
jgi:type I restriction enzyme R subunit